METTMPCINVVYGYDGKQTTVAISLGYLPLVPNRTGSVVRFPLDMVAEAEEYAEITARDVGRLESSDLARIGVPGDTSAVTFDQNAEELHEFAWGVGSNVVRAVEQRGFHKQHENAPPLFEGNDNVRFENMKADLLATNDILGERRDLADLIPEIMEMWAVAKKARYSGLWDPETEMVPRVIQRKMEMLDDRAISLTLGTPGMTFR
jgi:hypothetical protein